MIGGRDAGLQGLSSVEVIGLENCTVPDLPEWRYNHGSFVTEWGSLAVCGGWWENKPFSSDCLVLNRASELWERGILSEVFGNTVLGVISLDVGTYLVHPTTSSLLPSGKQEWTPGPRPSMEVQCATGISASSFLVFSGKSVFQHDSNANEEWLTGWPNLQEHRNRPGCATHLKLSALWPVASMRLGRC